MTLQKVTSVAFAVGVLERYLAGIIDVKLVTKFAPMEVISAPKTIGAWNVDGAHRAGAILML